MGLYMGIVVWLLAVLGLPAQGWALAPADEPLWVERVPTAVLVLMMGRLSDEPGSVVNRTQRPQALVPYAERSLEEQIAWQIKTRLYRADRTGWLDHWLFIRRARGETASVLTDPTCVRGDVYLYVMRAWAEQGRLSFEDERWARSVHHLRIEHPGFDVVMKPVYARLGVRRLVEGDRWRVRVHRTLYETRVPRDWEGAAGYRVLVPVGVSSTDWWDGNALVEEPGPMRRPMRWPASETSSARVSGAIYDGDPFLDIWWPAARIREQFEMDVATTETEDGQWGSRVISVGGVRVIEDARRYLEWLERSAVLRLVSPRDARETRQPPRSFSISIRDAALERPGVDPFTFGGGVRVVLEKRDGGRHGEGDDGPVEVQVMEGDEAWWALRSERDEAGRHVFFGQNLRVPLRASRVMENGLQDRFVLGADNFASNDEILGGYVEIRFASPYASGGTRALADMELRQLLTHPVRFRLGRSDAEQLGRLCKTSMYRAGRTELYTDEELEALKREHPQHTTIGRPRAPMRE